ncbi:MAG: hypothetical protein H7A46_00235 [Verrucomicrobiales bacterium]|nr:hypothetical protein [Verrucomicrobiales bacterium]
MPALIAAGVLVGAMVSGGLTTLATVTPPPETEDAFVGALLGARAALLSQPAGEGGESASVGSQGEKVDQRDRPDIEPARVAAAWERLATDFPTVTGWIRQDQGKGPEWLGRYVKSGALDGLPAKPAKSLGSWGRVVRERMESLESGVVSPDDSRWLQLYLQACRFRSVMPALRRVRVKEMRDALVERCGVAVVQKASPASWEELGSAIQRAAESLPPGRELTITDWAPSIEVLARSFPGGLPGSTAQLGELDQRQRHWSEVLEGVRSGDGDVLGQLPAIAQDVREFSRELLRVVPGMREYLDRPVGVDLETDWERQFMMLQQDLGDRKLFDRVAPQTWRPEALVTAEDRDPADVVLRRTRVLWERLSVSDAGDRDPVGVGRRLSALLAAAGEIPVERLEARHVLYAGACRIRREIAFSNPLLDFDQLLFIKRHLAIPHCYEVFYGDHCCDQYYGITQQPGGGLYVLEDAFGRSPTVRDLLAESSVGNGRLWGRKLEGGSFLSPDLSFDGRTVAFAYVECQGRTEHFHHTEHERGHWDTGRSYHLFTVNVDGANLRMLTDGEFNDFDPCFMPNGRIAFITERRGGYLRCGRVCPTYTLFDLAPDGSDIRCLSYHETNEWQPSVTHDGMIVWTRWDYIDRHGTTAHEPWLTTPDGCNPRPVHGNYSFRRQRADMELDVRAIPGSHRFVATGAPHHGQAFGSLIIVDPRVHDDDAMGPVRRLTPRTPFPENEGDAKIAAYGQAWPLSEDFFLCVYSPEDVSGLQPASPHGIYLLDSFGNQELIYADPGIASHNPIPVRARPMPPVVAEQTARLAAAASAEATVGVVNVYDTAAGWPEGTTISALRIFQVMPLSVASAAVQHATGLQIPQGFDSVNIVRAVLGTVPVEADGSAFFLAPARKELFFQALDEDGLAVTSMRSGTHFQPGENRTCAGCHESPQQATPAAAGMPPLAFRRAPSRIQPGPDGTHPFSYPRLVQPVLERHCVPCHTEHPDQAPRLDAEIVRHEGRGAMNPSTDFYASYLSLAPEYGFFSYGGKDFADPKWYRTTPGEFGARASRLYQMLAEGHHDVELGSADLERLVLWLDSCSMFYGVYEPEGGRQQLAGKVVQPTLE